MSTQDERINKTVVLLLVVMISALFLSMIRQFLVAIFMAAIFSALAQPLYVWLARLFGGRRPMASLATLLLIVIVVLIPLGILVGIVTAQAIAVSQSVQPAVEKFLSEPTVFSAYLDRIPYIDQIVVYKETILRKAGEFVGSLSKYLIRNLGSGALGTVNFLFMFFIMLYTMFFFLMDGNRLLSRILYYLPLQNEEESQLLDRFTSVSRATIKGTIVICILQGGLAGLGFFAVGIKGAAFWGTVMGVLSIIPGIGTGLVWIPAVVILVALGHYAKGIGLALFCGLVVGSIDNLVRPSLVGKDTQMHDLFILFGTLGGIALFGVVGIIIGPIIAALFVTMWDIYGAVFKDILPATPGYTDPQTVDPVDEDR
ncbi:MAG: AI-2E family transporter [Desulfobacterales bacterium]|nr:AI-2E family transporter [Desulfobacterales bacterium]MDJ0854482.1 AI-2E family transporter [Desulfobacterales bacterium]MDJ0990946.1 AI-2E family transporter [Desulfobacterales bacterium]